MRKLVRKDEDGWLTEVDPKALHREALALNEYIQHAPKKEEEVYRYRERLLPLVEAALNGSLNIPFKDPSPYSTRWIEEGLEPDLPEGISEKYFRFMRRIRGTAHISTPSHFRNQGLEEYKPEIVEIDGQRYQWVEFED